MREELLNHLQGISSEVIEEINRSKRTGEIIEVPHFYLRQDIDEFEYEDTGGIRTNSSYRFVERKSWKWRNWRDFSGYILNRSHYYGSCLKDIKGMTGWPELNVQSLLLRFVRVIGDRALEEIDDKFLSQQIAAFIRMVNEEPLKLKVRVWLMNIWLSNSSYQLPKEYLLRRPEPDDLICERPVNWTPLEERPRLDDIELADFPAFPDRPSAILELDFEVSTYTQLKESVELVLDIFRLFRLGAVFASRIISEAEFGNDLREIEPIQKPPSQVLSYRFSHDDMSAFELFFHRIKALLQRIDGDKNATVIGLNRFRHALFAPESDLGGKITSAITCLEALYLGKGEKSELSHRLAQRIASLLRCYDFEPGNVYDNVKKAYGIRSRYIHGSPVKETEGNASRKLFESVMDYARVSLVVHLQSREKKNALISNLDKALLTGALDEQMRDELSDFIVTK